MPAYAYAIKIDRKRKIINYDEVRYIKKLFLTLHDLEFVGADEFEVFKDEFEPWAVTVFRSRSETNNERDRRVAREEAYMEEYNKRIKWRLKNEQNQKS